MAQTPQDIPDDADTPEAKAREAARKAAQAAAIAEVYAARSAPPVPPTAPAAAVDPVPHVAAPKAQVTGADAVDAADAANTDDPLRLRDLVRAAVDTHDMRRSDAKAAIEAALATLGEALAEGRDVNLPGLGKIKIKRSKLRNKQRVSELRLRQKLDAPGGKQGVAEDQKGG